MMLNRGASKSVAVEIIEGALLEASRGEARRRDHREKAPPPPHYSHQPTRAVTPRDTRNKAAQRGSLGPVTKRSKVEANQRGIKRFCVWKHDGKRPQNRSFHVSPIIIDSNGSRRHLWKGSKALHKDPVIYCCCFPLFKVISRIFKKDRGTYKSISSTDFKADKNEAGASGVQSAIPSVRETQKIVIESVSPEVKSKTTVSVFKSEVNVLKREYSALQGDPSVLESARNALHGDASLFVPETVISKNDLTIHSTKPDTAEHMRKITDLSASEMTFLTARLALVGVGSIVKTSENRFYKSQLSALKAEMTFLEHELDRIEAKYGSAATQCRMELVSTLDEDDLEALTEEDFDDPEAQTDTNVYQQDSGSTFDSHSENESEIDFHDNLYSADNILRAEHDQSEYYQSDDLYEEPPRRRIFSELLSWKPSGFLFFFLLFLSCPFLARISSRGEE